MSGSARTLNGRDLPRVALGGRSTLWWGMLLLVVIEAIVVLSMVSSYYYLAVVRGGLFPPPDVSPPGLALPLAELGCAVASLVPAHLSVRFARLGRAWSMRSALLLGALFMVAYATLGAIESDGRSFLWSSHAYGSIVWTLSGYQYFHVGAVALLAMGFVGLSFARRFDGAGRAPLQAAMLYWDFVVATSAVSFVTLQLSPRFL